MKSTVAALQTLIRLGALDAQTAALTETGRNMSVMPTDPIYSKLLVTACKPQY
jgi:HrpA-like RNA helicase